MNDLLMFPVPLMSKIKKKKERKSKIKETTKEDFKIKGKFNY